MEGKDNSEEQNLLVAEPKEEEPKEEEPKEEELKEEEPKEPLVEEQVKSNVILASTLIEHIILFLNENKDVIDANAIKVSPEVKNVILKLCEVKHLVFSNIDISLNKVLADNEINANDIPELLNIILQTYNNLDDSKEYLEKTNPYEVVETLIKMSIEIIVKMKNIENPATLNLLNDILSFSIDMLKAKPIKPIKFNCLFPKCKC
jgi:hypothetical protein